MNRQEFYEFERMLEDGALPELAAGLGPYLEKGDLDARYFHTRFSVSSETGEEYDLRVAKELNELASLWHPPSMVTLAHAHYHGDDVEKSYQRYKDLLFAAALLGDLDAKKEIASCLELDLGWSGLNERIVYSGEPIGTGGHNL